jgi:hypothetical protein
VSAAGTLETTPDGLHVCGSRETGGVAEKEGPPPVYANVVQVTTGPFDVVLDFGFKTPEQARRQTTEYDIVARVAMSLAHAKTMLPLLARVIAEYEKQVGTIPAPGFDDQSKG